MQVLEMMRALVNLLFVVRPTSYYTPLQPQIIDSLARQRLCLKDLRFINTPIHQGGPMDSNN